MKRNDDPVAGAMQGKGDHGFAPDKLSAPCLRTKAGQGAVAEERRLQWTPCTACSSKNMMHNKTYKLLK